MPNTDDETTKYLFTWETTVRHSAWMNRREAELWLGVTPNEARALIDADASDAADALDERLGQLEGEGTDDGPYGRVLRGVLADGPVQRPR